MDPAAPPGRLATLASHSLALSCLGSRLHQLAAPSLLLASPSTLLSAPSLLLMLSLAADLALGWLAPAPPPSLPATVLAAMAATVSQLRAIIHWMMENPGGLKLSSVLSRALGNFFLYHIHLWETYTALLLPTLGPRLPALLPALRRLPLSLQLGLAGDLFLLLTVHLHCFHAYARRLARCQARGITALWRLFRGKKYNPLRDRVDSADCSVEQLFLGTIVFTILLFLFPTSLTFYCVFLALRTGAVAITAAFRAAIAVLHWLPGTKLQLV